MLSAGGEVEEKAERIVDGIIYRATFWLSLTARNERYIEGSTYEDELSHVKVSRYSDLSLRVET